MLFFAPNKSRLLTGKLFFTAFFVVIAILFATAAGQSTDSNSGATPSPTPTPSPSPTPIPLSAIVQQADATTAKLQEIKAFLSDSPRNVALQDGISGLASKVDSQLPETNDLIKNGVSLDELNSVQREWDGFSTTISGWKSDLQSQSVELDKRIADLKNLRDVWQRTLDAVTSPPKPAANAPAQPGDVVPEQLIQRLNETIASIDETQKLAEGRRSKLLTFQTRVSDIESKVSSVTADIKESRSAALSRLFIRDNPAIWKFDWSALSLSRIASEIGGSVSTRISDLRIYASAQSERFLFHGLIVLLLAVGLFWARGRATPLVKKDPELERSASIFRHPIAAALLLSIFLAGVLYPQAPKLLSTLIGAAALVPVVILLRRLVDKPLFLILDILVGFYFFDRVRDVVAAASDRFAFVLYRRNAGRDRPSFLASSLRKTCVKGRGRQFSDIFDDPPSNSVRDRDIHVGPDRQPSRLRQSWVHYREWHSSLFICGLDLLYIGRGSEQFVQFRRPYPPAF